MCGAVIGLQFARGIVGGGGVEEPAEGVDGEGPLGIVERAGEAEADGFANGGEEVAHHAIEEAGAAGEVDGLTIHVKLASEIEVEDGSADGESVEEEAGVLPLPLEGSVGEAHGAEAEAQLVEGGGEAAEEVDSGDRAVADGEGALAGGEALRSGEVGLKVDPAPCVLGEEGAARRLRILQERG